jgi:demethylmenaquinone methyltransferase/2-methoxy-6-polyprenyl-1,4-benzoquinol methylase
VSGNREAYTYLPDSILEFPSPEDVAQVMRDAGLGDVEVHRFTFGAATVHTGVKRG